MSVFTTAELDEQIVAYKDALLGLASHQSFTVDGTTYTKADLPEIRKTLNYLDYQRRKLAGTGGPQCVVGRPA